MQVFTRLITMLLALTLGGGAQFCLARCASDVLKTAAEQPICPHCQKHTSCPKSAPAFPCQRCQIASQDRATPDQAPPALPAPALVGIVQIALAAPPAVDISSSAPLGCTHGPPRDLLHQFCLLLI
jgi:hypothetical protein